ncbi:cytochrome P450 [Paenarthrobacter sp. NEAU-H11]|uniref:cytochrome P450 n=1 Tax=Paenarthrobacter sp. NEAU-H11 TaxID=3423924 RepID=UPI003D348603
MTSVAAGGHAPLDLTAPSFSASGAAVLDAREEGWCVRTNFGIAVLRHEEVGKLLKHPALRQGSSSWPAQNGITEGVLFDWWQRTLVAVPDEDHARIRRLVNPAFSKSAVALMTEQFRELAHELIDGFVASGSCEFMADFAEPFSARALCRLLGIPEDDWKELSDQSADLGLAFGPEIAEQRGRIEAAILALGKRADRLIEAAQRHPGRDVVSTLVQAAQGDGGLDWTEVRELIVQLIFGGMDTTRSQIGFGMHAFVVRPDQWDLLGRQPELGANAVEEVVRFMPTINWITRIAEDAFTFQGVDIAEGTVLHMMAYASGTDPLILGEGAEFDITAERVPHYGFGGGRHHCLGHFVARLDMREALVALADRIHSPRYSEPPTFRPNTGNTGPEVLPLKFDGAPARNPFTSDLLL